MPERHADATPDAGANAATACADTHLAAGRDGNAYTRTNSAAHAGSTLPRHVPVRADELPGAAESRVHGSGVDACADDRSGARTELAG